MTQLAKMDVIMIIGSMGGLVVMEHELEKDVVTGVLGRQEERDSTMDRLKTVLVDGL